MVRKEMWTCLLAYNLIRQTMLQSAQEAGVSPRALSFTAAMQSIAASWLVTALSDEALGAQLINAALASMAEHIVGMMYFAGERLLTGRVTDVRAEAERVHRYQSQIVTAEINRMLEAKAQQPDPG